MDKKTLQNILGKEFSLTEWVEVLRSVFGATNIFVQSKKILLKSTDKATEAYELGNFTTTDERIIGLYRVVLTPKVWLERNKVSLRELLRSVYKYDVDGAIIVFDQNDKWRLSFVSEIKALDDEGNIIEYATEPKRYTYLLGKNEKVRTPVDRLNKLAGKKLSLEDIREAFSVEALNKEFYNMVAEHFYNLVGGTVREKGKKTKNYGEGVLKLPIPRQGNEKIYQEFAVRLIGRIVFAWFLKVKKSDKGISLLPEELLSSQAVKNNQGYYHNIMERLFFQTLNTPMDKRIDNLPNGCEHIPFLNGGLFEPDISDYYEISKPTGLSKYINTLKIPDDWFLDFFTELEKYNFTIDENSTVDIEISVDPEMLGRIFENLLAEIDPDSGETARKATGSFYTPREIVDYMSIESLTQYLHNKTNINTERIRPIFKLIEKEIDFSDDEKQKILEALDEVKVLDPACGSGAFPMGVLHKIVTALQKLDPDAKWWKKRQVDKQKNPVVKKMLKEKLDKSTVEYAQKIGIIQNSLYGVDIQPIAAEISKLRAFLTLIVDENINENKPNRGIEPLPNLEFKFVTANTLIKLPEDNGGNLFSNLQETEKLKELRDQYLQSYGEEKEKIKQEFLKLQNKIFQSQIGYGDAIDPNRRAYKLSTWNPFSHEITEWFDPEWMFGVKGFDVVIGNPPYIQLQKAYDDKRKYADLYKTQKHQTFERTGDIYALFYERGIDVLQEKGNLCYITSNKWMRANYGKSLRKFFSQYNPLILIDLGPGIFSTATVDTNILLIEKSKPQNISLKAINLTKKKKIDALTDNDFILLNNLTQESWIILSPQEQKIKQRIEAVGTPLKDWDINIYRGVLTGYNKAFIIDGKTKDELIAKDPKSAEIIKPILRGRDIKRYKAEFADLWLIATFPALNLNIDDYPAIKEYLEQFLPKIKQTGETFIDSDGKKQKTRKKTGNKWFETQDQIAYYKEFEKEKIVYQEIVRNSEFYLDNNIFFPEATTFIITGKDIKYLISNLNSKPVTYFFKTFYAGGGLGEKGFRYKKAFLINLPIPQIPESEQKPFEILVDYILLLKSKTKKINEFVDNEHIAQVFEEVIDAMVMELYFEEEFHAKDLYFIRYVERDFKPIEHLESEEEKAKVINEAYQKLRQKDNEIRNNLKLMDLKLPDIVGPIKRVR